MELSKQVVSLELAKRLKELGVKQLDNSLWAWAQVAKKEKDALGRPLWSYEVVANNFQADIEFIAAIPGRQPNPVTIPLSPLAFRKHECDNTPRTGTI